VDPGTKHSSFGKDGNPADTIELHLNVRVSVRVAEVGQMRPPCGILCITFDNNSILI
jgi:hypothetical protein